jgi:hypothetical protein
VLDAFTMDGHTDDATRHACEAIVAMGKARTVDDRSLVDSLWNLFARFELSRARSERLSRAIHDAVLAVHHPSYGDKAVAVLATPVDPKDSASLRNELLFRQLTSVQLLGDMKLAKAVKPLILVLLSPTKVDLNSTVRSALLKMATEAEPELVKALQGGDPDYVEAGRSFRDRGDLAIIVDALGLLSRPAGLDAILAGLPKADTDTMKMAYAQALVQFPRDPRIEPAFLATYNQIPRDASVESLGGLRPRSALAESAVQLYDPSLVDWLIKEADAGTAPAETLLPLDTAFKLMPPNRVHAVGAALARARKGLPKEVDAQVTQMFDLESSVVDKCKTNVDCYTAVLDEPIASSPMTASGRAIKAACMAVVYGGGGRATTTRSQLVARLDSVKDASARVAVAMAIDALSPRGDAATADAVEAVVESDRVSGAANISNGSDAALARIALRLRARAAP